MLQRYDEALALGPRLNRAAGRAVLSLPVITTMMMTISAMARTAATAIVPQNITFGLASTSAPIHSSSSAGDR